MFGKIRFVIEISLLHLGKNGHQPDEMSIPSGGDMAKFGFVVVNGDIEQIIPMRTRRLLLLPEKIK